MKTISDFWAETFPKFPPVPAKHVAYWLRLVDEDELLRIIRRVSIWSKAPSCVDVSNNVTSLVLAETVRYDVLEQLLNEAVNHSQYQLRRAWECRARGDFVRYVLHGEPKLRVEAFDKIQHRLSDWLYWRLLGHVWKRAHTTHTHEALWKELLSSQRPERDAFIYRRQELTIYHFLPDPITAYRGFGPRNRNGFYYSLSSITAQSYANQHGNAGKVERFRLPKRDCLYVGGKHWQLIYVPSMRSTVERLPLPKRLDWTLALRP